MKACWVETKRSTTATRHDDPWACVSMNLRNAVHISEILGKMPIITDLASLTRYYATDYDLIFVGYSTRYSEFKAETKFLLDNRKATLVYVTTDYMNVLPASLFYANKPFIHVANYETIPQSQRGGKWNARKAFYFKNINALSISATPPISTGGNGAIYYGQYRSGRAEYLRLLNGVDITISTHKSNIEEYAKAGIVPRRYCDSMSWERGRETLRRYDASVWFEDTFTHKVYNCPPNRFYEAVSCGVGIAPHISVENTIKRSGYQVEMWRDVAGIRECAAVNQSRLMEHWRAAISERNEVAEWIKNYFGGAA